LLECGGATGRLPLLLAKQGWRCTLVDLTLEGQLLARKRLAREEQSAGFVTGDVLHLPFADETFDVVYSNGLLDVLPDINAAIREMARVIRPGGLFVAATNPRRWSVQTAALTLLSLPSRAWRLARRTAFHGHRPASVASLAFRNDFSLAVHLDACKTAGLRNIRGHGVGLLPIIALPGPLMRGYTQLTRLLAPLCSRFNWSEAAWTAKWGVMLAIYGFK
jgi:ubiquinone/menaquinone biosynthesis C-methylase UbiE